MNIKIIFFLLFYLKIAISQETVSEQICTLISDYRNENQLETLIHSPTLKWVSELHYENLVQNNHDVFNTTCNLHSWYKDPAHNIKNCCFPKQNTCMAGMAKHLTQNWDIPYTGNVVENAHASMGSGFFGGSTPFSAVEGWKRSPPHNFQLLRSNWISCGATLQSKSENNKITSIALLWLGDATDSAVQSTTIQIPTTTVSTPPTTITSTTETKVIPTTKMTITTTKTTTSNTQEPSTTTSTQTSTTKPSTTIPIPSTTTLKTTSTNNILSNTYFTSKSFSTDMRITSNLITNTINDISSDITDTMTGIESPVNNEVYYKPIVVIILSVFLALFFIIYMVFTCRCILKSLLKSRKAKLQIIRDEPDDWKNQFWSLWTNDDNNNIELDTDIHSPEPILNNKYQRRVEKITQGIV